MTNIIGLDCESAYNFEGKGIINPWMDGFYLTCVGLVSTNLLGVYPYEKEVIWFDHSTHLPTPRAVEKLQEVVNWADIICGHNIKFDVNVLRSWCGIKFNNTPLFCTMIGDYIITGQNTRNLNYSLNEVAERYGLPPKLDKVKSHWDDGTDTCDIPEEILEEYVLDDAEKPVLLYHMQMKKIEQSGLQKVIELQNEFSYSLSDMEIGGFRWDVERSDRLIKEVGDELNDIETEMLEIIDMPNVNLASSDHLSAILYGGILKSKCRKRVLKTYKTRPDKWVERWVEESIEIDGLRFEPDKKWATKKEGVYQTGKDILKKLKCKTPQQRRFKKLLLVHSVVQKSLTTLKGKDGGLSTKVRADGNIHPSFLQTITVTGRLSSRDPNGTNLPRGNTSPIKNCIISEEE